MTNLERIREMSEGELAEFLCEISTCDERKCPAYNCCEYGSKGTRIWLKKESEEE
jgi:hypothetical protein